MTGKLYLLGAGPGDPELITARAIRRLGEADLVLYDALVHPALLEYAVTAEECVFVGKRAGQRSERQARIQERILEATAAGKTVARLKGGDPFLFGRGSEEAELCATHGISFEVVPGVPSPMAASAYAGLTLTHREHSSSVAYITATESVEKDRSSHDWAKLATGPETLVLFMGMRKLASLMQLLMEHGRAPSCPAAVVQWASTPRQRTVVGTVADIAQRAADADLGLPALTIVGPVVNMRDTLRWYDRLPLFGRRVLVTRPAHQADEILERLRDEGAEPLHAPAIRIEPPADRAPLEQAIANLERYRWIIFTSANGVHAFLGELARQKKDARALGGARICAIGPATATHLAVSGLLADVVPSEYRGEAAAAAVLAAEPDLEGVPILIPRAAVAREVLPDTLRAAGAEVDVVAAYETHGPRDEDCARIAEWFAEGQLAAMTFTSPSTVRHVLESLPSEARPAEGTIVAAIGPITAAELRDRDWPVHVVAQDYTAAGLCDALVKHFQGAEA